MNLQTSAARDKFRWPVRAKAHINVSGGKNWIWEAISSPGNLVDAHPFVKANPVQRWAGADSRDEVHYLNGAVYRREFREWHEGGGYELEIFHEDRKLAWVSWYILMYCDAPRALEITVYPLALQHWPTTLRWAPHLALLKPRLQTYLDSVVRGFEWFITKGEPVPRNQFGKHPWYS